MSGLLKLSASLLPKSLPGAATLVRTWSSRSQFSNNRSRGSVPDSTRIPTPAVKRGCVSLARERSATRERRGRLSRAPRTRNSNSDGTRTVSHGHAPGLENLALPAALRHLKGRKRKSVGRTYRPLFDAS